jgi:hypothetical protein|nr:MAG TPA: hypothetical protein [Caudoviricetes sp.]
MQYVLLYLVCGALLGLVIGSYEKSSKPFWIALFLWLPLIVVFLIVVLIELSYETFYQSSRIEEDENE